MGNKRKKPFAPKIRKVPFPNPGGPIIMREHGCCGICGDKLEPDRLGLFSRCEKCVGVVRLVK